MTKRQTDHLLKQSIECMQLSPPWVGCNVLRMNHLISKIKHTTTNGFAIFFCNKQTYLLRKTLVQQHYFIECMHRFQAISLLQISRQNFPERLIVLGFLDHHTCLQGLSAPLFLIRYHVFGCSREMVVDKLRVIRTSKTSTIA